MHATCAIRIVEVNPAPANLEADQRGHLERFRSALPVCAKSLRLLDAELRSKAVDLSRLMAIVRSDASLAFQILGMANVSGSADDCDIAAATVLTGTIGLRALVRRISTLNERYPAPAESLTRHSQLAATLARSVAQHTCVADPALAYLGGLLHDIGKLVLRAGAEQAEHTVVGGWLAHAWGIPARIATCIAHHHSCNNDPRCSDGLLACVALANSACNLFGVPSTAFAFERYHYDRQEMHSAVLDCLPGLPSRSVSDLVQALEAEFLDWAPSLGKIVKFSSSQYLQGGVQ